MAKAAEAGMLVKLNCTLCHRTTYFLASDLLELYGDRPFWEFRMPCTKDGTAEFVQVDYRLPDSGDWGHLSVRRPTHKVTIQKWRTVKLGDPS